MDFLQHQHMPHVSFMAHIELTHLLIRLSKLQHAFINKGMSTGSIESNVPNSAVERIV